MGPASIVKPMPNPPSPSLGLHNPIITFIFRHAHEIQWSHEMDANFDRQVTDYLLKRGFNRTEEIFRQESKHLGPDGKPLQQLANIGPKKYAKAFNLLRDWVENNLDIYKVR